MEQLQWRDVQTRQQDVGCRVCQGSASRLRITKASAYMKPHQYASGQCAHRARELAPPLLVVDPAVICNLRSHHPTAASHRVSRHDSVQGNKGGGGLVGGEARALRTLAVGSIPFSGVRGCPFRVRQGHDERHDPERDGDVERHQNCQVSPDCPELEPLAVHDKGGHAQACEQRRPRDAQAQDRPVQRQFILAH